MTGITIWLQLLNLRNSGPLSFAYSLLLSSTLFIHKVLLYIIYISLYCRPSLFHTFFHMSCSAFVFTPTYIFITLTLQTSVTMSLYLLRYITPYPHPSFSAYSFPKPLIFIQPQRIWHTCSFSLPDSSFHCIFFRQAFSMALQCFFFSVPRVVYRATFLQRSELTFSINIYVSYVSMCIYIIMYTYRSLVLYPYYTFFLSIISIPPHCIHSNHFRPPIQIAAPFF